MAEQRTVAATSIKVSSWPTLDGNLSEKPGAVQSMVSIPLGRLFWDNLNFSKPVVDSWQHIPDSFTSRSNLSRLN
jgi:hypothetical protein